MKACSVKCLMFIVTCLSFLQLALIHIQVEVFFRNAGVMTDMALSPVSRQQNATMILFKENH